MAKRTPAEALNSLRLSAGDVERNPGPTQPCYGCGGATKTKELECVKCSTRCHKKCSSLTRSEAVMCQWQNSFICNQCNSSAGIERCSVCRKGIRLHQHRAICNLCSSPCHLPSTQLPHNDRDKLKTGDKQWSCIQTTIQDIFLNITANGGDDRDDGYHSWVCCGTEVGSSIVQRKDVDPLQTEVKDAGIGTGNSKKGAMPNIGGVGVILCRMIQESEERSKTTCVLFLPMPLPLKLRYLHTSPS